jgi:hypothetical protein
MLVLAALPARPAQSATRPTTETLHECPKDLKPRSTRTVGGIDLVKALLRPDRTAERQEARHAQDAATYITSLPKKQSDLPEWQAAIESLMLCSRGGDPMLARIGVMEALHRDVVPIAKKRIGASGSGINNSPLKAMRQNIAFLDATLPINVSDKK